MAGEVFGFQGVASGELYGSACLPESDDLETAYFLNRMYDTLKDHVRWARTEIVEVVVRYPETIELSEI